MNSFHGGFERASRIKSIYFYQRDICQPSTRKFLFRSSDEDTQRSTREKKNLMTHVNEFVILFTVNYSMHTCFNRESVPSYLSVINPNSQSSFLFPCLNEKLLVKVCWRIIFERGNQPRLTQRIAQLCRGSKVDPFRCLYRMPLTHNRVPLALLRHVRGHLESLLARDRVFPLRKPPPLDVCGQQQTMGRLLCKQFR